MELEWVISIFENKNKVFSYNRVKTLIHQNKFSHPVDKNLISIITLAPLM